MNSRQELIEYIQKLDDCQLRFVLTLIKRLFFPEG